MQMINLSTQNLDRCHFIIVFLITTGGKEMSEITLESKIIEAINQIRPSLQNDGGDIEFLKFENNKDVFVKLVGACAGCPMSQMTLKNGVEKYLRATVDPQLEVINATQF